MAGNQQDVMGGIAEKLPAVERAVERARGLGEEQRAALELLAMGKSVTDVAKEVGLSRTTVYRWLKDDPAFRAAHNQWQDEIEQTGRSRLLTLTGKAAAAIDRALEKGDPKTALQLLKGLGMLKTPTPQLLEEEELRKRMELDRRERQLKLEAEGRRMESDEAVARMMDEEFHKLAANGPDEVEASPSKNGGVKKVVRRTEIKPLAG